MGTNNFRSDYTHYYCTESKDRAHFFFVLFDLYGPSSYCHLIRSFAQKFKYHYINSWLLAYCYFPVDKKNTHLLVSAVLNRFTKIKEVDGDGRTFDWNPCSTFSYGTGCKNVLVSNTILITKQLYLTDALISAIIYSKYFSISDWLISLG